jgi:hypothetical protein
MSLGRRGRDGHARRAPASGARPPGRAPAACPRCSRPWCGRRTGSPLAGPPSTCPLNAIGNPSSLPGRSRAGRSCWTRPMQPAGHRHRRRPAEGSCPAPGGVGARHAVPARWYPGAPAQATTWPGRGRVLPGQERTGKKTGSGRTGGAPRPSNACSGPRPGGLSAGYHRRNRPTPGAVPAAAPHGRRRQGQRWPTLGPWPCCGVSVG